MNYLKLLLASTLLISIYACPDPDSDPLPGDDCRLTLRSFDITGDPAHGETYYSYNNDGKLTQILSEEYDLGPLPYVTRIKFEYNGDKLSQASSFSKVESSPENQDFRFKFYYEGDRLDSVKVDGYNAYAGHDYYELIKFTGDKIAEIKRYRFNSISMAYEFNAEQKITWNGNNIEKLENTNSLGETTVIDYYYDDKRRAFGGLGLAFSESDLSLLSENNVIRWTFTNDNGILVFERNITYTYNSQAYPETYTLGSGYPLYELEYNCN